MDFHPPEHSGLIFREARWIRTRMGFPPTHEDDVLQFCTIKAWRASENLDPEIAAFSTYFCAQTRRHNGAYFGAQALGYGRSYNKMWFHEKMFHLEEWTSSDEHSIHSREELPADPPRPRRLISRALAELFTLVLHDIVTAHPHELAMCVTHDTWTYQLAGDISGVTKQAINQTLMNRIRPFLRELALTDKLPPALQEWFDLEYGHHER